MAIRTADRTGTDEILRDARFHAAALLADPRTEALAEPVGRAITALRERDAAAYDADSARIDAFARLLRVDFEFDDRLRLVELDVQAQVRKSRDDPRYRAAFPKGFSAIVMLRGDEQSREARALAGRLREHIRPVAETHGAEVDRLAQASTAAEAAWRQAETDAAAAAGAEVVARTDLVRQLQRSEAALLAEFPGQRRRVRSFFRPTRRRGAAPDEGAPETDEGAPETDAAT